MITTGFSEAIADRIAAEHALLAARWFARLRDLLPVAADEVFPSDSLLDHIPSLIVDISGVFERARGRSDRGEHAVVEKARELGTLRHQQRASLHQVLREYQLLGSILLRFVEDESIKLMLTPPPRNAWPSSRGCITPSRCCCRKPSRPLSGSIRRRSPISPSGCASSPGWRRTNGASRWRRFRRPSRCCDRRADRARSGRRPSS